MQTGYGEYLVRIEFGMRPGDDYVNVPVTTTSDHNALVIARAKIEGERKIKVYPRQARVIRFKAQ